MRADLERRPAWCENLVAAARAAAGERALVVDEPLAVEGSQLAAALKDAGAAPRLVLWSGRRPLAAVPADVLAGAADADVGFLLQAEPPAEEAAARGAVYERVRADGGRMLFLGFVDGDLLRGELSRPPVDLERPARALLAGLEGARRLHVRGAAGTDLELDVEGRQWATDALPLRAGGMANFPAGEVFVAPRSAEGVLVADLTVPYTVAGLVDAPATLRFEGGRVVAIEKAARTAHVAIGSNTGFPGGDNAAAIHVDCVFSEPELAADGRRVDLP